MSDPALIVTGTASSSKGVARVVMTLNGAEVHRQSESGAPRSVVVSVPVTFVAGSKTLTLTAAEPDGTVRQDVRTIVFTPATTTPVVPPPPVTREQWAVVIGAGHYDSGDSPAALRGPRRGSRLPHADGAGRLQDRSRRPVDRTTPSTSRPCGTSGGRSARSWSARLGRTTPSSSSSPATAPPRPICAAPSVTASPSI